MKKNIKRLFGLIVGIIMFFHNFCYADIIIISPLEMSLGYLGYILFPVGIIVLLILIVSFLRLKYLLVRNNGKYVDDDLKNKLSNDRKYLCICFFILTFASVLIVAINRYYPKIWLIPISIVLLVAIMLRTKEKKLIAYTLYIIAIAIICISNNYANNLEKEAEYQDRINNPRVQAFNSHITPYLGNNVTGSQVNALIQLVIANNYECVKSSTPHKAIKITFPGNLEGIYYSGNTVTYGNNVKQVETGLNKYYKVEATYNHDSGYINEIIVTENQ